MKRTTANLIYGLAFLGFFLGLAIVHAIKGEPQTDPVVPGVVTVEQEAQHVESVEWDSSGDTIIRLPDWASKAPHPDSVWIAKDRGTGTIEFIKADGVIITDPDGKVTSWVKNGDR